MFFLALALVVVATGIVGAFVLPMSFFLALALAAVAWGIIGVLVLPIWKSA